jgi:S-adenosylmethionine-diacylgycerolhomoserine-N-methlytransferase
MDKMYRFQRYFYDFTRKYYLLGRDQLIDEMGVEAGDRILEIGCGTGRNLSILAGKYPDSYFYGLDASADMLETARKKLDRSGHSSVVLERALADEFAFDATYGLRLPFDAIFFSYSISMIPTWRESIENALDSVKPGGFLYFVDFYDQRHLPGFFARLLQAWLRQFHVVYPSGLIPFLDELARDGNGKHTSRPIFRSYSFISEFEKSPY